MATTHFPKIGNLYIGALVHLLAYPTEFIDNAQAPSINCDCIFRIVKMRDIARARGLNPKGHRHGLWLGCMEGFAIYLLDTDTDQLIPVESLSTRVAVAGGVYEKPSNMTNDEFEKRIERCATFNNYRAPQAELDEFAERLRSSAFITRDVMNIDDLGISKRIDIYIGSTGMFKKLQTDNRFNTHVLLFDDSSPQFMGLRLDTLWQDRVVFVEVSRISTNKKLQAMARHALINGAKLLPI